MDIAHDLTLLYAGWPAQAVVWIPRSGQGCTGRAIFDAPGTTILGAEIVAADAMLHYPTASFPAVRRGDRFVIGSQDWVAREDAQPSQDSAESSVPLERA